MGFDISNRDRFGFLRGSFDQDWFSHPIKVLSVVRPFLFPCQRCNRILFHVAAEQQSGTWVRFPFSDDPLISTGKDVSRIVQRVWRAEYPPDRADGWEANLRSTPRPDLQPVPASQRPGCSAPLLGRVRSEGGRWHTRGAAGFAKAHRQPVEVLRHRHKSRLSPRKPVLGVRPSRGSEQAAERNPGKAAAGKSRHTCFCPTCNNEIATPVVV